MQTSPPANRRQKRRPKGLTGEQIRALAGCPQCGVNRFEPCWTSWHRPGTVRSSSHEARMWLAQDVHSGRNPVRRHRHGRDVFYRKLGFDARHGRIEPYVEHENGLSHRQERCTASLAEIDRLAAPYETFVLEVYGKPFTQLTDREAKDASRAFEIWKKKHS